MSDIINTGINKLMAIKCISNATLKSNRSLNYGLKNRIKNNTNDIYTQIIRYFL